MMLMRIELHPRLFTLVIAISLVPGGARADGTRGGPTADPRPADGVELVSGIRADRAIAPAALYAALARIHGRIPSFSRQTRLACSACHYQFPQLTPFGRLFKMNGYTMTGLKNITAGDSTRPTLSLSPIPPVSAMIVASLTQLNKAEPAAQNGSVMFPEQLRLFLGGAITPRVGTFIQFTYAAQDGTIGMDNLD